MPYRAARTRWRVPRCVSRSARPRASPGEAALLANVTKRVTMWREVEPFYPDQTRGVPKTSESRATEAILNAVILSRRDARNGSLSDEGRRALDNMWALQMKTGEQTGAWTWLQFHNEPWEGDSSAFHGATLAAIAHSLRARRLRRGARRTRIASRRCTTICGRRNEQQPLLSRAMLLWASTAGAGAARRTIGSRRSSTRCSPRSRRTAAGAPRRSDRGSGTTARRSTPAPTATPPGS